MERIRRAVLSVFLPLLFISTIAFPAQRPSPRLSGPITERDRMVLAGSRALQAQRGQDLGTVAPETAISGITLVFKRAPEQEAALEALVTAQQNIESPSYHQWLTPDTFAARFGVADEDIAATEAWLQMHGFAIENAGRSHDRITFSGNAAQVQAAFGAELHRYQTEDGEVHFAPAGDLTLPAELGSITAAVLHVSDFGPKPTANVKVHPQPDFTAHSTQAHYLTPRDVLVMYDLNSVSQQSFNGAGQGIAVVGQSYVNTSTP